MDKKVYKEYVGGIGTVPMELPVIEVGQGNPKVLIVSAIHGDELSGIFILEKLLQTIELTKGKLTVMPVLNPLGFGEKRRMNPIDGADLNRSFEASSAKLRFSHYIAETVKEKIEQSDLIIDLHVFGPRTSLTTVIQYDGGNENLDQKNIELIKLLQPQFIWKQNVKTGEKDKTGTLMGYAYGKGKMTFGVEYTVHYDMTEKEIEKNVQGMTNILNSLGMTAQKFDMPIQPIPVIERINQTTPFPGLFIPIRKLGETIKKGEKVGELINPNSLEKQDILSEKEGTLFSIANRELLNTSEKMFTLAHHISSL